MKSQVLETIKNDLQSAMKEEINLRKANSYMTPEVQREYLKCQAQKDVSRSIISMFPEIGVKPDKASDDQVFQLLKKYISVEKTRELYQQRILTESDVSGLDVKQLNSLVNSKILELGDGLTSDKIKIAQGYLPVQASEEEIIKWIQENIDFSTFKNKMQAMGPIMKNFKGCDGNIVKAILMKV